jgi:hypothetical protein
VSSAGFKVSGEVARIKHLQGAARWAQLAANYRYHDRARQQRADKPFVPKTSFHDRPSLDNVMYPKLVSISNTLFKGAKFPNHIDNIDHPIIRLKRKSVLGGGVWSVIEKRRDHVIPPLKQISQQLLNEQHFLGIGEIVDFYRVEVET